jgi:uncharacterized FlaG/YvyC family protein
MKVPLTTLSGVNEKTRPPDAKSIGEPRKTSSPTLSNAEQEQKKIAAEAIISAIKNLTEHGKYSIHFELNKELDKLIIQVLEKKSGNIINQFPSEELIVAAINFKDYRGLIIETES